jgi:hypothetical protein
MDASVQIESLFTDGAERDICDYEDGLVDVFKSGKGDGEFETKLFSEKCRLFCVVLVVGRGG